RTGQGGGRGLVGTATKTFTCARGTTRRPTNEASRSSIGAGGPSTVQLADPSSRSRAFACPSGGRASIVVPSGWQQCPSASACSCHVRPSQHQPLLVSGFAVSATSTPFVGRSFPAYHPAGTDETDARRARTPMAHPAALGRRAALCYVEVTRGHHYRRSNSSARNRPRPPAR